MPRVAVCLSGCGHKDGTEIHEATLTLLALDQASAEIVCCAPDMVQTTVFDHHHDKYISGETRNVLVESARIARCEISDLATIRAADIDALIIPGGLGAAKNLCSFIEDGPDCTVHPEVDRLVGEMLDVRKPVGAICIAPALLARIVGKRDQHPQLTIGTDPQTAAVIEKMGARHVECAVTSFVVDKKHRLVTTPAYMLAKGPAEVYEGVRGLVGAVLGLI